MSATITWSIDQLERNVSDGLVTVSHWRVTAVDGDSFASNYGSVSHERAEEFVPFEDLTQEEVIGWVKAKLDSEEIEASLLAQIDAQKNPVSATGLPWAQAAA